MEHIKRIAIIVMKNILMALDIRNCGGWDGVQKAVKDFCLSLHYTKLANGEGKSKSKCYL